MKQFLLAVLFLFSVGLCQAQNQKVKPKPVTKPAGQTPPIAPPKPTQPEQMEKKKGSGPKSGIKPNQIVVVKTDKQIIWELKKKDSL